MLTKKEQDKLMKFIYSREQPKGGFSFSKTTPSTLEDTYFAVQLLKEINKNYNNKSTITYIQSFNPEDINIPKHLYYIATIYKIFNLQDQMKVLKDFLEINNKIMLKTLGDIYYLVLTKNLFNIPFKLTKNEKLIINSVEKKHIKSMEEIKQLVILMKKFNISFQQKQYVDIIKSSQNPDGGFGIIPNSTSYLEPTYHALKALKELNAIPNDVLKCEGFVYSCMTKISGFGRQTITVPNLEYSYYAIVSLKIIESMKNNYKFLDYTQ